MDYYINPACLSAVFTVPSSVVDRYLKLARGEHIKVLLFILRNMSEELSVEKIADETDLKEYDVKEALLYWADAGILLPKKAEGKVKASEHKKTVSKVIKPGRNDVARRGLEDSKIKYLLNETQMKLGRSLKTNEASTLVWLYDDEGLDISLILMIVQYAVKCNKANIRFIEAVAVDWINRGIDTIALGDEEIRKMALREQSWGIVQSVFGMEKRKPSKKEEELSYLWINEWQISKEMLSLAYEVCVNAKTKLSIPYVAKILENWHAKGYKTPDDIRNANQKNEEHKNKKDGKYNSYDMDLFEKMLNSKD